MVTKDELAKVITDNMDQFYGLAYSVTRNKHDAEDAVGQAVVISFERMRDIKDSSKMKAWVSTVVYNEALRIIKARKKTMLFEDADIEELAEEDKNMTPDRIFIWQKIFSLTEEQRTLLFMHFVEGLRAEDIQEAVKAPLGTVKTRIRQARIAFERIMKEGDENDD